jgi:hypothetical protein
VFGDLPESWNSTHQSRAFSQEELIAAGGYGLLYCFAAQQRDPERTARRRIKLTQEQKAAAGNRGGVLIRSFQETIIVTRRCRDEEISALRRPGSDLLCQVLRLSTIGAGEFNGRVRDGIGFGLPATTTRPAKDG